MRLALSLAAVALTASPAGATEVFAGAHVHAVDTPLTLGGDLEQGVDLSVGVRGDRIGRTPLQPYLFGALNTAGDTSFVAAGLSARFGGRVSVRPGLGLAIHNGSASNFDRDDRIAFGSRVLFAPELAVGAELNERLSVEASFVHLSHAQIFGRQNPGLDDIGVRLNWKL